MGYGEIQHGDLNVVVDTKTDRGIIFTMIGERIVDKILLGRHDSYPKLKYKCMLIHKDRLIVIFRLIKNSKVEEIRNKTTLVIKEFDLRLKCIYERLVELNSHITVTEGTHTDPGIFVLKCSHKHRYGGGFMTIYLDVDFEVVNRTIDSE